MMDFIDVVSLSHTQSYSMLKGDANSDFKSTIEEIKQKS